MLAFAVTVIDPMMLTFTMRVERKRQSKGIYARASFGAEVESWWHRESSIAGAERKQIS
jgi:stalled ribosome alternative rescue factor ArfA